MDGDRSQNPAYRATQLNMKVLTKIVGTFSIDVALMLHSIYTTLMSRNQEEPLFNRIEAARNILGISRADLAQMTGVHYQTIGYIERGEYNPSLSLALKLAKALGVEVSEIFSTKPFRKESK